MKGYERLGKSLQERARLNTISWDFPKGRNYSRGIGDTLAFLKNQSEQLPEPPNSLRNWEKSVQKHINPTLPIESSLEGNEGNMGEIMGQI